MEIYRFTHFISRLELSFFSGTSVLQMVTVTKRCVTNIHKVIAAARPPQHFAKRTDCSK